MILVCAFDIEKVNIYVQPVLFYWVFCDTKTTKSSEYLLRSYRMPGFHMFYTNCLILIIKKLSKVGILMTPLDEGGFFRLTELNN